MTQWIAVSRTEHAQALYWPRQGFRFARHESVVPVLMSELGKVLPHYVVAFTQAEEGYQPVVVTGLGQGSAYVTHEDKWWCGYVPAAHRAFPFRLANGPEGQRVFCIAEDHLTDEPSARPLFGSDGEPSRHVANAMDFLEQCDKDRLKTLACARKLTDAGVIEEWPLQIGRGEGNDPLKVNGLYRISEQALNNLDAETLHGLRGGPLALAYAQLFASHQLPQLTQRADLLAKHASDGTVPETLDSLFDSGDDDLSFDFDS